MFEVGEQGLPVHKLGSLRKTGGLFAAIKIGRSCACNSGFPVTRIIWQYIERSIRSFPCACRPYFPVASQTLTFSHCSGQIGFSAR